MDWNQRLTRCSTNQTGNFLRYLALRGLYTRLFEAIIIGDANGAGLRKVEFVLRDPLSLTGYTVEDSSCESLKVVGATGLEPVTSAV